MKHWAMSLLGRILVRLGRFAEAQECLDMMLGIEQTLLDPTVQFIPHLGYIDLAWCLGDVPLAEQHALRVAEIAEKHGSPYLRVFAFACGGTAKSIAKDFASAVRNFNEGLEFLRKTRAAMEYEPEILASLADCCYRTGESDRAVAVTKETSRCGLQRMSR